MAILKADDSYLLTIILSLPPGGEIDMAELATYTGHSVETIKNQLTTLLNDGYLSMDDYGIGEGPQPIGLERYMFTIQ